MISTFPVKEGEIVGITGLIGSGRTELAMSLAGMTAPDKGEIILDGKQLSLKSINDGVRNGIAFVPEDRLNMGLIMPRTVSENLLITTLKEQLNIFKLLDSHKRGLLVDSLVKRLGIKVPSVHAQMSTLSVVINRKLLLQSGWQLIPRY